MSLLTDACDAVVADIEANAGLPAHKVSKYVRPPGLREDQGSWLGVWVQRTRTELAATESEYNDRHELQVSWEVPYQLVVETNASQETVAKACLDAWAPVLARLETYGDGVPGLSSACFASVTDVRYGPGTGMFFRAWATLTVEVLG